MTEAADHFRRETLLAVEAMRTALTIARRPVAAEHVTAKDGRDVATAADVAGSSIPSVELGTSPPASRCTA
jgi:hypothetical protein